ncbi:hypothetical protein O3G_MSEX005208 [Manduca sexta]|uniref:non-specific serine/threonine protein kinase n=2 Tax=Manduca sexta TaxID=7130 RepID=A0A922CJ01_MANSE|nr:hypothetical protein O3G_MSEX005208 [Manduca sexta]
MRRTYKSKKDAGGGLDHRDVLLNLEEKSSAFDAFYIQNIKQTKRELSCVGSSTHYGAASNRVRKRKYVKRIVKETEPPRRESVSHSVFLTPDKSIRVNKGLDPFDMLLNSSPAPEKQIETDKTDSYEKHLPPRRSAITYARKKHLKKRNYRNSDSTDSEKENSDLSNTTHNAMDIKSHKLLVEKEHSASPKYNDESINNIVKNLSILNNLRQTSNEVSKTPRFLRLTKNIQSPILQNSPLCSTPFKEKYRGQSIYKFSPVVASNPNSPNIDISHISDCNDSVVFICKSNDSKKAVEPPVIYPLGNEVNGVTINKSTEINEDQEIDLKEHVIQEQRVQNENIDEIATVLSGSNVVPENIINSLHSTEIEPFLGYTSNEVDDLINERNKLKMICNNFMQSNNEELNECNFKDSQCIKKTKHNIDRGVPSVQNENVDKKATVITNSNIVPENVISSFQATEIESFMGFTSIEADELFEKRNKVQMCDNLMQPHMEDLNQSKFNYSQSIETSSHSVHSAVKETDSDDNSKIMCDIDSDDKESLYDTCDSEPSSESQEKVVPKEPIVVMERMSDSLFLKYYDGIANNLQDSKNTEEGAMSDGSCKHNTMEDTLNSVSNRSDVSTEFTDEISSCDTADVSTSEDGTTCHDAASSSYNEEQFVSFVTTRRRNHVAGRSTVSFFNNSDGSGSYELEKTVVSNNKRLTLQKTDPNQSNYTEVLNSSEVNATHGVRRTSSIKRRRRRYSKSNINVDNSLNTDSDDDSKEVTLYALPTTTEDVENGVTGQRKSLKRRSSKKFREHEKTCPKRTTDPENSNIDDASLTTSDNPAPYTDSDDLLISNESTDVLQGATDNNYSDNNEGVINIVSSVSESSENENDVTLYTVPDTGRKMADSRNKKISITTRKSARLSRRGTQYENPDTYRKSHKSTYNGGHNCNEDVANNKPSTSNERISTITTRKSSRIFHKPDINQSLECFNTEGESKPVIVLQPGKKWERSLSIYRRMTMMTDHFDNSILDESMEMKGRKYRQSVISTMEMQDMRGSVHNDSINSRRSTFVSKPSRSTIRIVKDLNSTRTSLYTSAVIDDLKGFLADDCDDTIVELSKLSIADAETEVTVLEIHDTSNRLATARDYVLRRCNQTDAILFDECYPDTVLKNCHKIGEGVYGEVFLWRDRDGRARVMKIVPIAGNTKVNGENQKDYGEIISEIVIAMELSALRAPIADIERHFAEGNDASALDLHTVENATDVFNEVLAVRCVYGSYPSRLLDLWDLYDECKGSENDNPAILPVDQQYIVLELANAGQDLESYQFNNAEQAYALFYQIAFGLAVGEEAYQFEHRDLHWGNVLIAPTDQKYATFVLRGRVRWVPRRGVAATIIDYSLSRLALPLAAGAERAALYNDLAHDDGLFDAVGDYQFQVYRLMRDKLGNDWKNFEPYTNILWLHYTVDKMITALRYKRTNTKIHKHYIEKLKGIKNRILDYKSAAEFVLVDNEY